MAPHDTSARSRRTIGRGYSLPEVRLGMRRMLMAFAFVSAFTSLTTGAVFTSFLTKHLQVDDLWYGIIMAIGPAAVFVQYLGSFSAERAGRLKPKYLHSSTLQRLLWLGMAAVPLFLTGMPAPAKIGLVTALAFCTAMFAHYGSGGMLAWLSDMVPKSITGRFFGLRQRAGMLAMLAATIAATQLLDHYQRAGWVYGIIFVTASLLGLSEIAVLRRVKEIPRAMGERIGSLREIVRGPWAHRGFRSYALFAVLAGIATTMIDPFVWRYCYESRAQAGLGMNVSLANALLFILPTLVLAWMAPGWGRIIDRHGPKPVLVTCMTGLVLTPLVWVVMRPELIWLVPLQTICNAILMAGLAQVEIFMRVKGFPDRGRTSFLASINVTLGVAGVVGTVLAGAFASGWHGLFAQMPALPAWISHYHPVFLTAILLRLAILLFIVPRVLLPGSLPRGEVLKALVTDAAGRGR